MELNEKIRKFIESNLITFDDDIQISDDDNIFQLGFVNSLFAMKMIGYIEREFNISIENDDLDIANFTSVVNIVRFINLKKEC
jgi:acyl carrier protein